MGSKTNYTQLIADRAELEEKTRKQVLNKLSYLRLVGRSVMYKTHGGYDWMTRADRPLSYLGESLEFFLTNKDLRLIELKNHAVVFSHPKWGTQNPNRTLEIPSSWLFMSDRDFAKLVRSKVTARKAYERRLAVNNAASDLRKAEEALEKQKLEVTRLKGLLETAKDKNS